MGQQQQNKISGDIFTQDGIVAVGRTFVAITERTIRSRSSSSSSSRLFLNEESSQHKYLAFSLNYSSNCDYNNR